MRLFQIILLLCGSYLLYKAGSIYSIYLNGVDGDGIGLYLLGFIEINDTVPAKELPTYVKNFLLLGITLIITPILILLYRKKLYKE